MSFQVSRVSRWRHHNYVHTTTCTYACAIATARRLNHRQAILFSSSLASPARYRSKSCASSVLDSRTLGSYYLGCHYATTLATRPAEVPSDEAAYIQALSNYKEPQEHSTSVSDKEPNSDRYLAEFQVRLKHLPISPSFVAHPSSFPTLPNAFTAKFLAVFNSFCARKNLQELRDEYAGEIDAADTVWKTQNLASLESWLSPLLNTHQRIENIVSLLIGSLLTSVPRILHVLNTLQPLDNDFEVRANCLYMTGFLYKDELLSDPELMHMFDHEVNKLRQPKTWPGRTLKLHHIRLLLWRSDNPQVTTLLSLLELRWLPIRVILLLTMFCAQRGMHEQAFSFFKRLPHHVIQKPKTLAMKCCSVLLKHDIVVETEAGPNFQYLPTLLERGLPPDALLYSRIIERALDCEYPGVAWDIYRHTQSIAVEVHWRTVLLLLRHAFTTRNIAIVDEIMAQIHTKASLQKRPELLLYAMNMVRRINHSRKRSTAAEGLSHILALYDRAYARRSLAKFGFVYGHKPMSSSTDLPDPDVYILSFTVWAYVLCHKHADAVQSLWKHIVNGVTRGDATITDCMRRDLIYNAFIWLHFRNPETIPNALKIFQYMLEQQLCVPTARTWTILICGYLRHDLRDQARQMYDLMRQHQFTIKHVREEYLPRGVTLEDLEKRLDDVLDEESMPDGSSPLPDGVQESVYNVSDFDPFGLDLIPNQDKKASRRQM